MNSFLVKNELLVNYLMLLEKKISLFKKILILFKIIAITCSIIVIILSFITNNVVKDPIVKERLLLVIGLLTIFSTSSQYTVEPIKNYTTKLNVHLHKNINSDLPAGKFELRDLIPYKDLFC